MFGAVAYNFSLTNFLIEVNSNECNLENDFFYIVGNNFICKRNLVMCGQ